MELINVRPAKLSASVDAPSRLEAGLGYKSVLKKTVQVIRTHPMASSSA